MLYLVPTPLGNLEDITLRALRLLKEADTIITEDSRMTRKLMNLLEIANKPAFVDIIRNHNLNWSKVQDTLKEVKQNQIKIELNPETKELVVLLVTDAGTPGVSDPGIEIIRLAQEMEVKYTVLPGPSALVPAVVASGLVSKEFVFLGFLPIKKGRQSLWQEIIRSQYPIVVYESVHRIEKFLAESKEHLQADRKICICNDLSKKFEQIWVGKIANLQEFQLVTKGEFVIVIEGEID